MLIYQKTFGSFTPARRHRRDHNPAYTLILDEVKELSLQNVCTAMVDIMSGKHYTMVVKGAISFVHWKDQPSRKRGREECLNRMVDVVVSVVGVGAYCSLPEPASNSRWTRATSLRCECEICVPSKRPFFDGFVTVWVPVRVEFQLQAYPKPSDSLEAWTGVAISEVHLMGSPTDNNY